MSKILVNGSIYVIISGRTNFAKGFGLKGSTGSCFLGLKSCR